jgi:hypothetical protein
VASREATFDFLPLLERTLSFSVLVFFDAVLPSLVFNGLAINHSI